jgi:hypothetical protein
MAADQILEISILSGTSAQPTLTFNPGTPSNPVSIGSKGQWAVAADGVEPVHLYVVFDGRQAFVALAATGAQVHLAGAPVGTEWVPAPVPCELRFGGACLILRHAPRPVSPQEERTMHDGGALLMAARRAGMANQPAEPSAVRTPPLAPKYPSARPAAGLPAAMGRTLPLQGAPPRIVDAHDEATTIRNPLGAAPQPLEPIEQEATLIAPQPMLTREPEPLVAAAPEPAPPVRPQTATMPPTKRSPATASTALAYWREASAVKKATLVLMPFALVGSYIIFQPDPPPPQPRATAPASSAARQATATRDAGGGALAASPTAAPPSPGSGADVSVPPSPAPTDAPTRVSNGKRTPERAALDAVAAGSFDEASRLYADLASAHPDDPSYKEAARILRERTGGTR